MLKAFLIRAGFAILLAAAVGPLQAQSKLSTVGRDRTRPNTKTTETHIYGAGSSIVNPLLSAWADDYNHLHSGRKVYYQAAGSRNGLRFLIEQSSSFAVTDVALSAEQLASANGRIVQFPVALNGVVPVYNLAQVPALRLSGSTLAGIFLGVITRWDDAAIAADNPGVELPQMNIKVVHHFPDDRETDTRMMAEYLSTVSPGFKATLAKSSQWPVTNASAGYIKGAGRLGFIAETPGSIGYSEFEHIRHNSLTYAAVKNPDGEFVKASLESLTASAASAIPLTERVAKDFRVSIVNAPGEKSYPIASFVWLVFYGDSGEQSAVVADFLKWILADGQRSAAKLGYPSLPSNLVEMELQRLRNSGK
jgi:phosphate transport system substrate-binding protein